MKDIIMTIEEKVGQMFCPYLSSTNEDKLHKKGSPFSAGTILETIADAKIIYTRSGLF